MLIAFFLKETQKNNKKIIESKYFALFLAFIVLFTRLVGLQKVE